MFQSLLFTSNTYIVISAKHCNAAQRSSAHFEFSLTHQLSVIVWTWQIVLLKLKAFSISIVGIQSHPEWINYDCKHCFLLCLKSPSTVQLSFAFCLSGLLSVFLKAKPPLKLRVGLSCLLLSLFQYMNSISGRLTKAGFAFRKQSKLSGAKKKAIQVHQEQGKGKVKFLRNLQIKCIWFSEVAFALFSKRITHKMGNGNVCWISCDVVKTLTISVPKSHSAKIVSTIFLVFFVRKHTKGV